MHIKEKSNKNGTDFVHVPSIGLVSQPQGVENGADRAQHSQRDKDQVDGTVDQAINVTSLGRRSARVLNQLAVLT